jgi:inosine/xanthosine triphosphatase
MKMKRIVVASRNPAKLNAVETAFSRQFPDAKLELLSVDVDSSVGDQPASDHETRQGARNRARAAKRAHRNAEFWVGLEGGIEAYGDQLMAFAWMAVLGSGDNLGEARTVTLPLPPAVKKLIDGGLELGEAKKVYQAQGIDIADQAARVRHCVQSAFNGRRIMVFSGGAKSDADSVYDNARAIRDGGGNGSIIGRNTFQRPRGEAIAMLNQLIEIYRGKA